MGNIGKRLASEQKSKTGRKLTRQQIILIVVVALLAAALAVVLAIRSLFVRPELPSRNDPQNTADADGDGNPDGPEEIDWGEGVRPRSDGERKSEDFYTVLILGRDTGGGGNTDTILLASYDVTNQKATVMSIPRDTMVNVSWDVKKINSVYNVYGGGEKGIQHLYKEISQLVGFEPDFQVIVEWEAVGKIVDAMGGVWFDVPYEMDYHDPYQDLVIRQSKGYRLLSGDDAMQVIRWRENDNSSPYGYRKRDGGIGDSGRMELQQSFLKVVVKQLLQFKTMTKVGPLIEVFENSVETDLNFQNILWFAQSAVLGGLKLEDVEFITMPWRGTSAWSRSYHQNLSYVVPIPSQLLKIVNEQLSPFKEAFTMRDLDIMSVNADGSVSSSTGHVEDSIAARPPERPSDEPEEEGVDENGNPIDPETGTPVVVMPEGLAGGAGTTNPSGTEPSGGAEAPGGPDAGTSVPKADPAPDRPEALPSEPAPETPPEIPSETPPDPQPPEDTGFTFIEPPPDM